MSPFDLPGPLFLIFYLFFRGKWIGRILDDHLHDPPEPVYDLLAALAARCPNPLTVILERDGAYPPMPQLLAQLDRARAAVEFGRARLAA